MSEGKPIFELMNEAIARGANGRWVEYANRAVDATTSVCWRDDGRVKHLHFDDGYIELHDANVFGPHWRDTVPDCRR